ncbi:hypothetical protein Tco_0480397 [Tanacetum coccineum]
MWEIRIKQYLQIQDYALWEVVENGNSWVPVPVTTQEGGTSTKMMVPATAEEKTCKKNDVKVRSLLLMSLPNEHQLTFSQYDDAQSMFVAIKARFGGNDATKKTHKALLKQQYENFNASSSESLDSIFNRLQKLVKKSAGASNGDKNLAFVTTSGPSSTNDINTVIPEVSTTSTKVNTASTELCTASFSDAIVYAFMSTQPKGSQLFHEDLEQLHDDDLEEMDLKAPRNKDNRNWNQGSSSRNVKIKDTSEKAMMAIDGVGFDWSDMAEEQVQTNMALMAFSDSEVYTDKTCSKTCLKNFESLKKQCDDLLVKLNDSQFKTATYKRDLATLEEQIITYKKNEVLFSEEVVVLKREVGCKEYELGVLRSELEKVKQEKDGIDFKIKDFNKFAKDLDEMLESLDEFKEPEVNMYGPRENVPDPTNNCNEESDNSEENTDDSLEKQQVEKQQVSDSESSSIKSPLNFDKDWKEKFFHLAGKVETVKSKYSEKPFKRTVRYAKMANGSLPFSLSMVGFVRHTKTYGAALVLLTDITLLMHGGKSKVFSMMKMKPEVNLGNIPEYYTVPTTLFKVPTTPHTRVHINHPLSNVIRNIQSSVQARRMKEPANEQGFLSDVYDEKTHEQLNTCLQVKQKEDGIFISQDKYVAEILRKFKYTDVKTASTTIDLEKPLVKDGDAEDVDVHLYRSMIGSLMYLISSRPDIMDSLFELVAYSDSDYVGATQDRNSTAGGCQFLGSRLISWQCKKQTIVATSTTEAEYVATGSCRGQVLWIQNQLLDYGSAQATTKAGGVVMITATIDGQVKTITEASLRRHLILEDHDDMQKKYLKPHTRTYLVPSLNAKVFNNMKRTTKGYPRVEIDLFPTILHVPTPDSSHTSSPSRITSSPSLLTEHSSEPSHEPSTTALTTSEPQPDIKAHVPTPHDSPLHTVHSHESREGSMQQSELTVLVTKLYDRIKVLVQDLLKTKKTYSIALTKLVLKVKKLHKLVKTDKSRRRAQVVLSEEEDVLDDSSKQGRKILDIDEYLDTYLVQDNRFDWIQEDTDIQKVHHKKSDDNEVIMQDHTPTEVIQDQGSAKRGQPKVSTAGIQVNIAGVTASTADEPTNTASVIPIVSTASTIRREIRSTAGRVVYSRRSMEKRDKGKAIMTEPEPKKKSKKEIEQERLSLAEAIRLQEQINEEQKAQIVRDDEIAKQWEENKPQTDAQARQNMITYLNNQSNYKARDFKAEKPEEVQEEKDEGGDKPEQIENEVSTKPRGKRWKLLTRKRSKDTHNQDSLKRQKIDKEDTTDYEKEKEELRMWLSVVPNEEAVVNPEILHTRYPIVDWESQSLGDIHVYKIIRADGNASYHKTFESMDKYIAEILRKFNYIDVKSTSTTIDLEKPFTKDEDAEDVDGSLLTGGCQFLEAVLLTKGFDAGSTARHQELTSPEQTAPGKDSSNLLIVDSLLKTIWDIMPPLFSMKHWLVQSKRLLGVQGSIQLLTSLVEVILVMLLQESQKFISHSSNNFGKIAEATTDDDGEIKITATIDGQSKTITEASLRRHLKLEDHDGVEVIPNTEIFEQLALMGYNTDSNRFALDNAEETNSKHTLEHIQFPHSMPRVNKLETRVKTGRARRRARLVLSEEEHDSLDDSSKQGRKILDIDEDPDTYLAQDDGVEWIQEDTDMQEAQHKQSDDTEREGQPDMRTAGIPVSTARVTTGTAKETPTLSTAHINISTASTIRREIRSNAGRVVYSRRSIEKKDKGKAIMTEPKPDWIDPLYKDNGLLKNNQRQKCSSKAKQDNLLEEFRVIYKSDSSRQKLDKEETTDYDKEKEELRMWLLVVPDEEVVVDLKTLFDPDEEDEVWRNQHEWRLLKWKLHEFSEIHTSLATPKQTAIGKDYLNPFMADSLPKTISFVRKRIERIEFCDKHNMVAFLEKSTGSEGFHQVIDFLNRSYINYALTKKPEVYVSFIKQIWRTAEASTGDNREVKITAIIDGQSKFITEASLRRHLKLEDHGGLPKDIQGEEVALFPTMHHEPSPSPSRNISSPSQSSESSPEPTTTAGPSSSPTQPTQPSPEAEEHVPTPYDSPLYAVYSYGNEEGSQKLNELTNLVTILSNRIGVLGNYLKKTKQTYSAGPTKLILKVKKLERKVKIGKERRKTRLVLSEDEDLVDDSSRQGRKISDIDEDPNTFLEQDEGVTWFQDDTDMQEVQHKQSDDTEVVLEEGEPTEIIEDKGSGEKGQPEVNTAGVAPGTASNEPSMISTAEVNISTASTIHSEIHSTPGRVVYSRRSAEIRKDKGKAIMTEPEPKKKSKKELEQERLSIAEAIR